MMINDELLSPELMEMATPEQLDTLSSYGVPRGALVGVRKRNAENALSLIWNTAGTLADYEMRRVLGLLRGGPPHLRERPGL